VLLKPVPDGVLEQTVMTFAREGRRPPDQVVAALNGTNGR
jgi:hypothetical protein